jgi:hypothetical protein
VAAQRRVRQAFSHVVTSQRENDVPADRSDALLEVKHEMCSITFAA